MVFVRAKTIKGKKYAYLVENTWKNGKVKQSTKKYLGKVIDFSNSKINTNNSFDVIDFEKPVNEIFKDLIIRELTNFSFQYQGKNSLIHPSGVVVKLSKRSKFYLNNKNIVLFFNKRYVYPKLFDLLLNFYEPESDEDKKGEKLAFRLRDAGINISQNEFVNLYKKIYLLNSNNDFVKKSDFNY
jgi:hypothetical protein